MQASCDIAFDYAHHREAFDQKIGTFQVYILLPKSVQIVLINNAGRNKLGERLLKREILFLSYLDVVLKK